MIESAQVESPAAESPVTEPERKPESITRLVSLDAFRGDGDVPDARGSDAFACGGKRVPAQCNLESDRLQIPITWTGRGARCTT